jgi:hypothetical protein
MMYVTCPMEQVNKIHKNDKIYKMLPDVSEWSDMSTHRLIQ